MVRLKDIMADIQTLRERGMTVRYNDSGVIMGDLYGCVHNLFYKVAQHRHPQYTLNTAASHFEDESMFNTTDFYTAVTNRHRAGRRARWLRRLIMRACGLPRWQRQPQVSK